jgi:hypothetical protein
LRAAEQVQMAFGFETPAMIESKEWKYPEPGSPPRPR